MRRFIKLLSPLLLAALFISCAQSVKQNGSINLDGGKIVSRAVQYSINKSRSPETGGDKEEFTPEMVEAMKEALEFKANLAMEISSEDGRYKKSAEEDYNIDYSSLTSFEKKTIKFNDVPVGIKASINATITTKLAIKDESALLQLFELMDMPMEEFADFPAEELTEKLATAFDWGFTLYGKSELTVHEGENPVTLKMTADPNGDEGGEGGEEGDEGIAIGGTIEPKIPQTLTIKLNESASDTKVFLNKGTLAFKLLDEEGNEVTADPENPDLGNAIWTYKLSFKNTEIPDTVSSASGEVVYYEAEPSEGKIEIKNLPAAGTYQLYVQFLPTWSNQQYDAASALFDLPVENTTYYSFSVNSHDDDYINFGDGNGAPSNAGYITLNAATTDVYLKLHGEDDYKNPLADPPVNDGIRHVLSTIKAFFSNYSHSIFIDASEMTAEGDDTEVTDWVFQNFSKLKGVMMPNTATVYSSGVFKNCTNLEYVKFGEDTEVLNNCWVISDGVLFNGCSSLSKVEFEKPQNWYNSETSIVDINSINWSTLELIDVSDPEANATHIKNGDWGYLYRKTE